MALPWLYLALIFLVHLKSNLAADAALLVTTLIWGSTFIVAKDVLTYWPPIGYLTVRFCIAALALVLLFPKQLILARKSDWAAGATLGLLISGGFALQAIGQVYTTPAKSAFITGLTTPLVPVVAYFLLRVRPGIENTLGIVLATLGGALILAPQAASGAGSLGDLFTLACTGMFAMHITLISVYAERVSIERLTVVQITVAAGVLLLMWLVLRLCAALFGADGLPKIFASEAVPLVWTARVVWQLLYLALIATVVTFLLWVWGQARLSATRAAIIFSLEPVFAVLFAVAVRGRSELLGGRAGFGALLVLAGVIVSELRWSKTENTLEQA